MTTVYHFCEFCNYRTIVKCNLKRHQISKHCEALKEKQNVPIITKNVPILRTNVPKNQTNVPFSEKIVPIDEKEQNNEETYTCEKCNKNYKTKKYYNNHVTKCNGVHALACPRCRISFTTRSAKSKHIKNHCKLKDSKIIYINI
jgi:uncharacterized C2H2 Zn-finger protein